ncbi:MAG TPA: hypothetical protein VHT00_22740 [Stellaceae bacterium]|jgi:hypothetical protein|nr:hypothetical protein [Stellaceae bacterium]
MLQARGALRALVKKCVVLVSLAVPVLAGNAWADGSGKKVEPALRLLSSVPIPISPTNTGTGTFSFDISWVDQSDGTYYLADRNNQAVDALFAESIVKQIVPNNGHAPFAGISPPAFSTATAGPNGVVAVFPWLFVTDAPSRVLSFDLRQNPPLTVSEVTTLAGEPTRADELAYDPKDGLILAINNASTPPFGTLISVNQTTGALAVVKNIFFDAAHGVDAQNGAEQPVWDPGTQKFFLSIPQLGPVPTQGAVIRISTTGTVEATYLINFCSPAGLALGPHEDLLVGCNTIWATNGSLWTGNVDRNSFTAAPQLVILNAKTGSVEANVLGAGVGDEVWFNKGDNHYYATGSGSNLAPNALFPARPPVGTATTAPVNVSQGAATLDVIDALSETLDQRVPTLNVPANDGVHAAGTAHSVAADADTNHVFVPIAANNAFPNCLTGCITIYGRDDPDQD